MAEDNEMRNAMRDFLKAFDDFKASQDERFELLERQIGTLADRIEHLENPNM